MKNTINAPKVSIIVPVYNVEKYLPRCLDSLRNQTLKEIEIILVDDQSPDKCPDMCDGFAEMDNRVKVVHKKKNGGLGFARNSGLKLATGEYVAFIDSDDYVDLTMFDKLYSTAKLHTLDTVYCGYNNVDNKLKVHPFSEVEQLTIFDSEEDIKGVLLDMIASGPSASLERKYRMSVWHGIYSKKLLWDHKIKFCSEKEFISEDIIFHIDYLTKASRIAFIPDPLYYYCFNDTSLTKVFRADRFQKNVILYNELIRKFNALGFEKHVFKLRVDRFFMGYVRNSAKIICRSDILYGEKKKLLREICSDDIWNSLADYPFHKMPVKHKLFMFLIKNGKTGLLINIFRMV